MSRATILSTLVATLLLTLNSCSNGEPFSPSDDSKTSSLLRTPNEAIEIALRARSAHFGEASNSRSKQSLAYAQVLGSSLSRTSSDTLLYAVNFGSEEGFAFIAANRSMDPVLGVSDCGTYIVNENENPGVNLFVNMALVYLQDKEEESEFSATDLEIVPIPDLTQYKEWEDTTFYLNIKPRLNWAWGQGLKGFSLLETYPEGFYFSNNLCGCGPVAVAQSMVYFSYPDQISSCGQVPAFRPNWSEFALHKKRNSSGVVLSCGTREGDPHLGIARLCRVVGNHSHAVSEDQTGVEPANLLQATRILGYNPSDISAYTSGTTLSTNPEVLIQWGEDTSKGFFHAWVVDGEKNFTAKHYYSTKTGTNPWVHTLQYTYSKVQIHINWGWYGNGDGWYSKEVFHHKNYGYTFTNIKFFRLKR